MRASICPFAVGETSEDEIYLPLKPAICGQELKKLMQSMEFQGLAAQIFSRHQEKGEWDTKAVSVLRSLLEKVPVFNIVEGRSWLQPQREEIKQRLIKTNDLELEIQWAKEALGENSIFAETDAEIRGLFAEWEPRIAYLLTPIKKMSPYQKGFFWGALGELKEEFKL